MLYSAAMAETPITAASAQDWLALAPEALLKACGQARFQGSGPGGQKRNRVYSGVRVTHPESGLTAESVDSRDSARNVGAAIGRLRLRIALAGSLHATVDPDPGGRVRAQCNPPHADFPRLALRALCVLAVQGAQVAAAAAELGCTASALTRFLKAEKAVWARVREMRIAEGLHPLK